MRELKFRAWHKDNYIELNDLRGNKSIYFSPYDLGFITHNIDRKEVVLEQYTGLKDKNGKEIYEGDIVSEDYRKNIVEYSTTDVWSCNCCNEPFSGAGFIVTDGDDPEDWEVIGNIHENPELLEQEDAKN